AGEPQLAKHPRRTKRIVSQVCLDDVGGPRRFSSAKQRQAESRIRVIGVQCDGPLERGYRVLVLALEGQNVSEVGMSDREIGIELNGLPSETMRAFEGSGAKAIFIQRVDPSRQVGIRKSGIGTSIVRVERDRTLKQTTRFIKVGHVERRPHP